MLHERLYLVDIPASGSLLRIGEAYFILLVGEISELLCMFYMFYAPIPTSHFRCFNVLCLSHVVIHHVRGKRGWQVGSVGDVPINKQHRDWRDFGRTKGQLVD